MDVLASLPTRDQALAMLARVLAEPASMFARAVKAVADKQGGGEEAPSAEADRPERLSIHDRIDSANPIQIKFQR